MTMEELRQEAARILALYHDASDANEMLALSTRYTKIDMLVDKREKLLAQGVPMSEIIQRTTPAGLSTPATPPPVSDSAPSATDAVNFDSPVDDGDFAEFDNDPLPEVKSAAAENSAPEAAESETPNFGTPTSEMNDSDPADADAVDSIHDEDTARLSVSDISSFEPKDEENQSKPLSVPDINLESDSDLETGEDADDASDVGQNLSEMPTPIMPLKPIPESELETPVPPPAVHEIDLDTPVEPEFTKESDDRENTTIITVRKDKPKTDFGLGALNDDVGFDNVDKADNDSANDTGDSADDRTGDEEVDADDDTVIMKKKKFSFLQDLDEDNADDTSPADKPESSADNLSAESSASDEASSEPDSEHALPAFEIPSGAFAEGDAEASEGSSTDAFRFDAEKTAADASEGIFDSDGDDDAVHDVLTTPFEASDAEMESFGFESNEGAAPEPSESAAGEESAGNDDNLAGTDEPESSELGDFEQALASLNAIEGGNKPNDDELIEHSEATEDDAAFPTDASSDNVTVESMFDIDDDSSKPPTDSTNEDESVFNFDVDTQVPLDDAPSETPDTGFADLTSETEESSPEPPLSTEEAAPEEQSEEEDVGFGNLPALGDAISEAPAEDDEADDADVTPESEPAAAEASAPAEESRQEEKEEESTGLPAFELPPFDPEGLASSAESGDSNDTSASEPSSIPDIAASADSTPNEAEKQEESGALPPIGDIPPLGSSAPAAEEKQPEAPAPSASSAPTTPSPTQPVSSASPSPADVEAARAALKGQDRLCASCGERTEITDPSCMRCYYRDESLGIVNAVMSGDSALVQKLLRIKPELINTRTKKHNWTLLHMSSSGGNMRLTKMLIEKGCDVNEPNVYGKTALHYAASKGHVPVIHMLLSAGADTTMKFDNKTALELAMEHGRSEAIAALQNA